MIKTITITMILTDSEYKLLEEEASNRDLSVEGFLSEPISYKLYDIVGDPNQTVSVIIE